MLIELSARDLQHAIDCALRVAEDRGSVVAYLLRSLPTDSEAIAPRLTRAGARAADLALALLAYLPRDYDAEDDIDDVHGRSAAALRRQLLAARDGKEPS